MDRRIGLKQFTEDFAATLRESVQSHRRITWMFAGSHHFNDLPNVRWSSYLVSLRTLELPPFTPEETRLLLSQPLKHSRRKEAQAAVVAFGTGFWGEGGMDRIHAEAGGWPHLVQLIASTVVDLCNTQGKARADAASLEVPTLLIVGGADLGVIELTEDAFAHMHCEKKLAIVDPQDMICQCHLFSGTSDPLQFQLVVGITYTCRVDQSYRKSINLHIEVENIARCSRDRRNNGGVIFE